MQKSIFQIAHIRSLKREDVLACGPFVKVLYAAQHEEDKQLFKYDSLLHYVARLGDVISVRVLLDLGFDVNGYKPDYNYKDKNNATINTTPLGVAIASDKTNVARVLLDAKASINLDEFVTATSKRKLTEKIESQDMRDLLVEFGLEQIDSGRIQLSFNEQVLLAANRRLMDEIVLLHKRLDKLSEKLQNSPAKTSPAKSNFFQERVEARQEEQPVDDRDHKRSKMSDID